MNAGALSVHLVFHVQGCDFKLALYYQILNMFEFLYDVFEEI